MQFKYPEILYALFALIIPIIVHLFQLQRFVKVPFTNVKFLKNIEQQTRKSARLKKWLVLLSRLLAFACLIIAFAQPYFSKYSTEYNFNTNIYLDNSFSMQAKGENGELLKSTIQKIIEKNTTKNNSISIITNNENYLNLDSKNLKTSLLSINYYPNKLDLSTAILKLNSNKITSTKTLNENILISDFQEYNYGNKNLFTNVNTPIDFIKVSPVKPNNIFIDSVYIEPLNSIESNLIVVIKNSNSGNQNVPISLFNQDKLIGKTTARIKNNDASKVNFSIPNTTEFNGKIQLIDDGLEFDNELFFTLSKPQKINILNIGIDSEFLSKIYTNDEFNYSSLNINNLNYNNIQNQHLIILNEIEEFPIELISELNEYTINGGNLVIIPSQNFDMSSYNNLLSKLGIGRFITSNSSEHKITAINYDHPLMKGVFEKQVKNFEYPKTKFQLNGSFKNSSAIINLDNNKPFISLIPIKKSNIYIIASPLNNTISNFTQSPLIVPVFYNFAKYSLQFSNLYYTINPEIIIDINASIKKDEVLKMSNGTNEFIPLQEVYQNKVRLILQNNILKSGFYNIIENNETIKTLAFNYNRKESNLFYTNIEQFSKNNKNISLSSSIDDLFSEINNQQKINWLFKWFLAFSVLFLLIEILLLKYFNI